MTRHITPHKGGRTSSASGVRLTPQERERLDAVLAQRGVKHTDWYIGHVNQDYEQITGGNMDATTAHELAEKYAGIENENATVTPQIEGSFKVELSSDITVYVNVDGDCEIA